MATDPAAVAKSRRGRSQGQLPHVLSLIQLRLLAITCTLSVPFRMTLAPSWAMGPTEAHQQRPSWSSSHARVSRGAGISATEVALDTAVRIESMSMSAPESSPQGNRITSQIGRGVCEPEVR